MPRMKQLALLPALLILGACAVYPPAGPSAMALPGTGKNFDQFRGDDMDCRQYANLQSGGATQAQAATDSAVSSAVVGTAIGALAGAALGGDSHAAAAGAGMGLLTGTMVGTGTGTASAYEMQRRYDMAYLQCMYAKGHRVPVGGRFAAPSGYASGYTSGYTSAPPAAPAATTVAPPPPPGTPPPPPPR